MAALALALATCSTQAVRPEHGSSSSKPAVAPAADQHPDWLTCNDQAVGVFFKYPKSWALYNQTCSDTDVTVNSPNAHHSATYFRVDFRIDRKRVYTFSAVELVESKSYAIDVVQRIGAANSPAPLYLVGFAGTDWGENIMAYLTLTNVHYKVGQNVHNISTSFDVQSGSKEQATCLIDLRPPKDDPEYGYGFAPSFWTTNPSYSDLIQVLDTLRFRLPLQL